MNLDETGKRISRVGRALGSLCLVILAAAWTLEAMSSPASAESSDAPGGEDLFESLAIEEKPTTARDRDCQYLRLSIQSPHGSGEGYQRPLRELLSTSLSRAGFEIVRDDEVHYWWASSLAQRDGSMSVWTTVVHAEPEIRSGGIQFTTTYKNIDGTNVPFHGVHSLRQFRTKDAPQAAMQIADGIAQRLLPAAHQRCDEALLAANREAEAELERVRSELTREMERVRREGARRPEHKRLEFEVEQKQTVQQRVSGGAW